MKKISVLLAANIPGPYDYLVSDDLDIKFGFFVRVPFRNKELIGIIWDDSSENIEKSKNY